MRKVLIVDDSVTMRQMVNFTLREGGFDVVEAEHGQDALNKLKNTQVDLIITDLNMPVMDGISLIRNVRKQLGRSTPVLMLTTEGHATKKEEGKAAGATGWIVKPFDPEKLLLTIARVLP